MRPWTTAAALVGALIQGGCADDEPTAVQPGAKLESPGTYVTPEVTLKLGFNSDDVWTVSVLEGGETTFTAEHGSKYSRWFGYVESPRVVWFYSGDVGDKRLTVGEDGTATFEGFPRDDAGRRAFVGSMPDGFIDLLPKSVKKVIEPYRAEPPG